MSVNEESVRDSSIEKVRLNTIVELSGDEKQTAWTLYQAWMVSRDLQWSFRYW